MNQAIPPVATCGVPPQIARSDAERVGASPRILLVRLSAIGDCLHALPVATALRAQLPGCFLGWAIQGPAHQLLGDHPAVDRFHLYPRALRGVDRLRAILELRRELRRERYDWALDVQGLFKSGLVGWMSGARERVGFEGVESREFNRIFQNSRIAPPSGAHVVDRNLSLLQALDLEPPRQVSWELPLPALAPELAAFLEAVAGDRPLAMVNPGTTWDTKRWPVERFAAVARGLAERGLAVVVGWGDQDERARAEAIVVASRDRAVHSLPPTSLRDLAAVLARCRLFVGNDTGPLHLAVALGTPVVAVFGATDPTRNGPYGDGHEVVVAPIALACRPCQSDRCARRDLACLTELPPEPVLAACDRLLARPPRAALAAVDR